MRVFLRRSLLAFCYSPSQQNPKCDRAEKDDEAKPETRIFRRIVQFRHAARDKPDGEQCADCQIDKSSVNDDFSANHKAVVSSRWSVISIKARTF